MKKRRQISSHWQELRRKLEDVYIYFHDDRLGLDSILLHKVLYPVQTSVRSYKWNN